MEASVPRKSISKRRSGSTSKSESVSPNTFMPTNNESCSSGKRGLARFSEESIKSSYNKTRKEINAIPGTPTNALPHFRSHRRFRRHPDQSRGGQPAAAIPSLVFRDAPLSLL